MAAHPVQVDGVAAGGRLADAFRVPVNRIFPYTVTWHLERRGVQPPHYICSLFSVYHSSNYLTQKISPF